MKRSVLFLILAVGLVLMSCAGNDMVLSNQGFEALSKGNYLEAGEKFQEALSVNPYNPYALLNMGVVYQMTGQPEKARRMYERVIALQPQEKAKVSTVESFSGRTLTEIAKANLETLAERKAPAPASAPETAQAPVPVPPLEAKPSSVTLQKEQAPPPEGPSHPPKELNAEEPTYYMVRESGTLMDIAGRDEVYGDDLKWPSLFRLNPNRFQTSEDVLHKKLPRGLRLRVVTRDEALERARKMGERLWVVNAASVRSLDKTVRPAVMLMRKGYHVYLDKTELAGEEWIRMRVGFYQNILKALAVCAEIKPLLNGSEEPCVSKIDKGEYEEYAGY